MRAPSALPDRDHAYHLFAIAVDFAARAIDRGALMRGLAARGIGTQVHYIPLPQQPFHRDRPGADAYYQRTLSLPMYPDLTPADVRVIVATLATTLAELSP